MLETSPSSSPAPTRARRPVTPAWIDTVMAYRAPFLIAKLVRQRLFTTDEAEALFTELKRYFVLNYADPANAYSIVSNRVDEVWHQFILFTADYRAFCQRYFGGPLEHLPSNAPVSGTPRPVATFDEFVERYRALFGERPSDLWRDELAIGLTTRVAVNHEMYPSLSLRRVDAKIELVDGLVGAGGEAFEPGDEVVIRIDDWGAPALEFALRTGTFFVRELPGLAGEDRVAICRTLVRLLVLRVSR